MKMKPKADLYAGCNEATPSFTALILCCHVCLSCLFASLIVIDVACLFNLTVLSQVTVLVYVLIGKYFQMAALRQGRKD